MLHLGLLIKEGTSLSARRAWIEIMLKETLQPIRKVALRKESVDRNMLIVIFPFLNFRRSPQGERG